MKCLGIPKVWIMEVWITWEGLEMERLYRE
jgi:hypothetical protein